MKTKRKFVVVAATRPLDIVITQQHIDDATPKCPENCVVGMAVQDTIPDAIHVEVGSNITKVVTQMKDGNVMVTRYATPSILKKQIPAFDQFGRWDLPAGKVSLLAMPKTYLRDYGKGQGNRWHLVKGHKTKEQSINDSHKRRVKSRVTCPTHKLEELLIHKRKLQAA